MSRLAGMSADTRNKTIAVVVFVVIAAGILYFELFSGGTPNPVANAPVVVTPAASANLQSAAAGGGNNAGGPRPDAARAVQMGNSAHRVGGSSAALDPALRMDAMLASESVEYSGVGRNIFSPNSAPPVVIPKPIAPVRPLQPVVPQQPVHTGPPPPPPIELTFFGTETDAAGVLQAILLHQDAVYTAKAGDIVLRRYRIVSVNPRSIQVEDMLTNNRQTLPMAAN